MEYEVGVKEISYGFVTVEANSPEEAQELAYDLVLEGQANWGKMDVETGEVKEVTA